MKKASFISMFVNVCVALSMIVIVNGDVYAKSNKPILLKIGHGQPTVHHMHNVLVEWAKKIEQRTNNRVKFKIYPVNTLCPPSDIYEALSSGLMDFGSAPEGYTAAHFPLNMATANFMLGLKSAKTGSKIRMVLWNEFPALQEEFSGTHVLWLNTHSGAHIHTKSPVRNLDDLKNIQLRTPPGIPPLVSAMGAVPVVLPMPESYEALQKNIVKGYVGTNETLRAFRLAEVTKFTTEINFYSGSFFMAVNKRTWSKLPKDVKEAIEELNEWGLEEFSKGWDEGDVRGVKFAKELGHEFIQPSEKFIDVIYENIVKKVHEPWAEKMESEGKPGKAIMKRLNMLLKEYQNQ